MLKPGARFVGGRGEAIYRAWSMGGCSGRDRDPTGPTAESNVRRGAVATHPLGQRLRVLRGRTEEEFELADSAAVVALRR